jgi:benzoyl-CoA reductase/2-hydroxyglutaryl-CoA dehydratase subunit BcrC/BadD/HgdB
MEKELDNQGYFDKLNESMESSMRLLKNPRLIKYFFRFILSPLIRLKAPIPPSLLESFYAVGAHSVTIKNLEILSTCAEILYKWTNEHREAVKSDKPIVWVEWAISHEILTGFDVWSFCPESYVLYGQSLPRKDMVKPIDAAEKAGFSKEGCTSQQGAIGAFLLSEAKSPKAIIAATHPCDSGVSVYQALEYITKSPTFILTTPYWRDKESIKSYAKNIRELIAFLEKQLNQKFNWNRFKETIEKANVIYGLLSEISEMGRLRPLPYSTSLLHKAWSLGAHYPESDYTLNFIRTIHTEALKRAKKGKGCIPNEKIRILWWDVPITCYELFGWLIHKYGAIITTNYVAEFIHDEIDTSSEESMLEGLALSHLRYGMRRQTHGPIEYVTDEMEDLIEKQKPDCLIFAGHLGCKHNWAATKIIKSVGKKMNVPTLYLTSDIFDPREVSLEEVQSKIDTFFKESNLI